MRRLVADKDRWSQQLVLRPADLLHLPHAPTAALAAVHFGSMRSAHERRVATIAHSADPAAVHYPMLPASVDDDLAQSAELQSQRAKTRDELLPRLQTLAHDNRPQRPQRPPGLAELWALDALPRSHISFGRIYRLHKVLAAIDIWRGWFDAWVRDDRMHWQAAVLLATRARASAGLLPLRGAADRSGTCCRRA
jgi:hypothetical protein